LAFPGRGRFAHESTRQVLLKNDCHYNGTCVSVTIWIAGNARGERKMSATNKNSAAKNKPKAVPAIFIGWSGARSEQVARALHDFLASILEGEMEPWMSQRDIFVGQSWLSELHAQLKEARFGIFCLTPENRHQPWLLYELGVLSSQPGRENAACPLLFDLDGRELTLPWTRFQQATADEKGLYKLLDAIELQLPAKLPRNPRAVRAGVERFCDYLGTIKPVENHEVFFDCTAEEFEEHLVAASRVTVVGVTNEGLVEHLRRARRRRQAPWEELQVVFTAKHLLPQVYDPAAGGPAARERRWEGAVTRLRDYLMNGGAERHMIAKQFIIRRADRVLPFVGQLYDEKRVRVAFALPDRDMRDNCYINFPGNPPCCGSPVILRSGPGDLTARAAAKVPPCKTDAGQSSCEGCTWEQDHSPCRAISTAIKEIRSSSTPLFVANVVGVLHDSRSRGRHDARPARFLFRCLAPQREWQHFRFVDAADDDPVHLLTFVLVRRRNKLILLPRTKTNSSDQRGLLSVVSGKVNDEDFFLDEPNACYRKKMYQMQMAHYDLLRVGHNNRAWLHFWETYLDPLTREFCRQADVRDPLTEPRLIAAGRKAALRYVREKLRLVNVAPEHLRHLPGNFVVNRTKKRFRLFPIVFLLDIGSIDAPGVAVQAVPIADLPSFEHRLTEFLAQYSREVMRALRKIPWKPPETGHAR
jgi:hypothetical protein